MVADPKRVLVSKSNDRISTSKLVELSVGSGHKKKQMVSASRGGAIKHPLLAYRPAGCCVAASISSPVAAISVPPDSLRSANPARNAAGRSTYEITPSGPME